MIKNQSIIYTITIFLSAYLLFLVQPMAGKALLPVLGGAPSVWNTAMVFFQILLLGGYLYAHLLGQIKTVRTQVMIHLALFITAFACLPMAISFEPPENSDSPLLWQIATMFGMIGLPFFVLSTSAPLLQKWFSLSDHKDADNPYFLYAASNIGSVLALLLYPIVVEQFFPLQEQTRGFQIGFALLGACIAFCGLSLKSLPKMAEEEISASPAPELKTIATWILLAFVPSSLMLGFTTFVTNDVGATPLFWIIPLTLYILSFVVAFSRRQPVPLSAVKVLYLVALAACTFYLNSLLNYHPWIVAISNGTLFFLTALMCHQQLSHLKPKADHMTLFYLMMSIGGALGGIFNALIAPVIFLKAYEFMVATALGLFCWGVGIKSRWFVILPALVLMLLCPVIPWEKKDAKETVFRNYFGSLIIIENEDMKVLSHGTTTHGMQSKNPKYKSTPLLYYSRETSIAEGFDIAKKSNNNIKVAGLGMGTGAITCLLGPTDDLTFFEIDPNIIRIATDKNLFSYTSDCKTPLSIIQGDARLELKKSQDHSFDMVFVDVFSGDNIPMHLLTLESAALYLQKTKEDGIIMYHLSNRYLKLANEVGLIARSLNMNAYHKMSDAGVSKETGYAYSPTDVVILTKNPAFSKDLLDRGWEIIDVKNSTLRPWTDTYANLLRVIFKKQPTSSP